MKKLINKESPLLKTIGDFMFVVKALMAVVFIGFCFSGVTLVKPDEVGMIMRMGKLVGANRLDQIHQPGWVLAFPRPIDNVIKIPIKQILEVKVSELNAVTKKLVDGVVAEKKGTDFRILDPVIEGYCISGDENIFQTSILVKFQITDPIAAAFKFSSSFATFYALIHDLTVSEMVKMACRFNIDGILSENKKELSLQVRDRVQGLLDTLQSGLTIVSLELEEISPPIFLKRDFEEVNTAFINRRNFINEANGLREEKLPQARGQANEIVNRAHAYQQRTVAAATAAAGKFSELLQAYLKSPTEVKASMLDKARANMLANLSNVMVLPSEDQCQSPARLFIYNSGQTGALPLSSPDLYSDEDEY